VLFRDKPHKDFNPDLTAMNDDSVKARHCAVSLSNHRYGWRHENPGKICTESFSSRLTEALRPEIELQEINVALFKLRSSKLLVQKFQMNHFLPPYVTASLVCSCIMYLSSPDSSE
jgi:hypothetical protein